MKQVPLQPFGLRVECPPGTTLASLEVDQLRAWVDTHRVVQLRGVEPVEAHELASQSRRLGPLQPWRFGAVHELEVHQRPENYLYTEHAVPLHWDGAFADAVPHYLIFHCVRAPPEGTGGETVFVDTRAVLERAPPARQEAWRGARVKYSTEKKAHYGGSFVSAVVKPHATLGFEVLRYAEPVDDLNPVTVEPLGCAPAEGAALQAELSLALADGDAVLTLPWEGGDYVFADNHALLHGRRAFTPGAPRHLRRVNVLDPDRRWWASLRAAWRVRRPEFFRAEVPILLIPALLSASAFRELASPRFLEGCALFFLLFNVGDLVNCWLDREVDLHRKTHLSEAIALLGRRSLLVQIVVTAVLACSLAVHLALSLDRWWLAPAGLLGVLLGAGYTAPPLRLKSRGLLQLLAHAGLLFIGPMMLVAGLFVPAPSLQLVVATLGFAAMQTGVLLVNNAEDLDEDERAGIFTASVALQARGAIRLARWLVLGGGALLVLALGVALPWWLWLALAPLGGVALWNGRWLSLLWKRLARLGEPQRREAVRKEATRVPRRIEAGAWAALLGAMAVLIARAT